MSVRTSSLSDWILYIERESQAPVDRGGAWIVNCECAFSLGDASDHEERR
jgi:hypothetical protein